MGGRMMANSDQDILFFANSSCQELGRRIASELGVELAPYTVHSYSNGCFEVELEPNVRGRQVFFLFTSLPNKYKLHWQIFELFEMVNAAKKASASEITVAMPHISYARSDKKWTGRLAIAGKVLVACLEKLGIDRFLGLDLHSPQFELAFDVETKVDHLRTLPSIARFFREEDLYPEDSVLLPGDESYHKPAEEFGELLKVDVGTLEKTRIDDKNVRIGKISGDVEGKTVLLVDDGLATGATMRAAVSALRERDPDRIVVAVPTAPAETCSAFEDRVDEIVCVSTPRPFFGVGGAYRDFSQTTNEEVREFLERADAF